MHEKFQAVVTPCAEIINLLTASPMADFFPKRPHHFQWTKGQKRVDSVSSLMQETTVGLLDAATVSYLPKR
jgi:hypothetical protein